MLALLAVIFLFGQATSVSAALQSIAALAVDEIDDIEDLEDVVTVDPFLGVATSLVQEFDTTSASPPAGALLRCCSDRWTKPRRVWKHPAPPNYNCVDRKNDLWLTKRTLLI